jgi:hypothetical protein
MESEVRRVESVTFIFSEARLLKTLERLILKKELKEPAQLSQMLVTSVNPYHRMHMMDLTERLREQNVPDFVCYF